MTQRGFNYLYSGTLTGTVNDVAKAQAFLTDMDMTQFLHEVAPPVVHIRWDLKEDGHTYEVHAVATQELTAKEIADLTDWVKGQNSDGLGEGFEQQDFADCTPDEPEYDPYDDAYEVDASDEDDEWRMVSFDWRSNDSTFVAVVPCMLDGKKWMPV